MHIVAILALHGVVPFDLAVPCGTFTGVRTANGGAAYDLRVCGEASTVKAGLFDVRVAFGLEQLAIADTVIVPGISSINAPISEDVLHAIAMAAKRGARIASICSGAFVLAAAGLLDGLRATTHWLAANELAARYPMIKVDANVLFVDNGNILTSAGAAAGIDLCLHMVRKDHGAIAAAAAARRAVVPLERHGSQAQFIVHEAPTSNASLAPVLQWMQENLAMDLSLRRIAEHAGMSTRTLGRKFFAQTGTTPLQWVLTERIRRAQSLLESTDLSVEQIATRAGFANATGFRDGFSRAIGTPPTAYRRAFTLNSKARQRSPQQRIHDALHHGASEP